MVDAHAVWLGEWSVIGAAMRTSILYVIGLLYVALGLYYGWRGLQILPQIAVEGAPDLAAYSRAEMLVSFMMAFLGIGVIFFMLGRRFFGRRRPR